jgi:hypothetical protein
MWQEIYIQFLFGFLLTVITALMGYMAKAITDFKALAAEKIAALEADIKNTNRILSQIIIDLKIVEGQGTAIAVLQSQLADLRVAITEIYERIRKLELGTKNG